METIDLGPTATEVARLVAGVRDEQLAAPTPCTGVPVGGLLDHLVGLTGAFALAARKEPVSGGPRWSPDELPADWRTRLPGQLTALAAAWGDPAAWEGMAGVEGVRMPAAAMGVVAANEVLLHGWDLAVATGQRLRPDHAVVARCLAFAVDLATGAPDMRNGMYGPVVPVPAGAPAFDRLLGQAGRDPGWRPA